MKVLERAKFLPVSTRPEKPRCVETPPSITGIYRLSVKAKKPFVVDIGARKVGDVRSLEVFHVSPMYMDSMHRFDRMQVWGPAKKPERFRIDLSGRLAAGFRITADELLPEQLQLDEKVDIASLNTKMPYTGFFDHLRTMREERNPRLAYHFAVPEAKYDELLASSIHMGAMTAMAASFAASAFGLTAATSVVVATAVDPWRTYINGHLCKNLKEVKVSIRSGEINGYMTP